MQIIKTLACINFDVYVLCVLAENLARVRWPCVKKL